MRILKSSIDCVDTVLAGRAARSRIADEKKEPLYCCWWPLVDTHAVVKYWLVEVSTRLLTMQYIITVLFC